MSRDVIKSDIVTDDQTSAAGYVAIDACNLNAKKSISLAYTIKVATNSVDWIVYGANLSDYSDEVVVQAEATVAAGAASSYAVTMAPYLYYRVKIKDTGVGHGVATVTGVVKG